MNKSLEGQEDKIARIIQGLMRDEKYSVFSYEQSLLVNNMPYVLAYIDKVDFPPFEVEIQMSSRCNLQCVWCVGLQTLGTSKTSRLKNNINKANISRLIDSITRFRKNGLKIKRVKFSGLVGDPLFEKDATLEGLQSLYGTDIKVSLFSNGVSMGSDTWPVLSNIEYVHVSLDAGPRTFCPLKESAGKGQSNTFFKIISNIKGLAEYRSKSRSSLKINIGYVVIPENFNDIWETTRLVKESGADSIRFKCDISGKYDLGKAKLVKEVFREIEKARQDFHNSESFSVYKIHLEEDVAGKKYRAWHRSRGCLFHNFLGTIGSDGNLYVCDHNALFGAIPFGNTLNEGFDKIWENKGKEILAHGVSRFCISDVCPPFGNRLNHFLAGITSLLSVYGRSAVGEGLENLRDDILTKRELNVYD